MVYHFRKRSFYWYVFGKMQQIKRKRLRDTMFASLLDEDPSGEEDSLGMRVTSGKLTIHKDDGNMIGISIGGGAPLCPCLYIVQIFDNTPAAKDGTLESGDEILSVNGTNVKGKTKVEVAKMIQSTPDQVVIGYNKLHADPKQGKSLDIVLKKVKHAMVERMSASTADALGLSRAILCNDSLVKKLEELQRTEDMYRGLVAHTRNVLVGYYDLVRVCKELGDEFCKIGNREPQKEANEAFSEFGEYHRQMEKFGIQMLKRTKPILSDLGTYLSKAIPDTKLTIKRYADVKFEYLSYCLKVKELDDEDISYQAMNEPLYRVETGNYEYRLILRCRADARKRFAALRSDVLVKMELLDNKHVQDIVHQLRRLMESLTIFHLDCQKMFDGVKLFPIELQLGNQAFQYNTSCQYEDEVEEEEGTDALTDSNLTNASAADNADDLLGGGNSGFPEQATSHALIQGLEGLNFSSNSSSSDLNGLNMNSEQPLLGLTNQMQDSLSHQHQNYFTSPANPPPVLMPIQSSSTILPEKSVFDQHPNVNISQAAPLLMPTTSQQESAQQSNLIIGQTFQQSTQLIGQTQQSELLVGPAQSSNQLIGQAQSSNQLIGKARSSNQLIGPAQDSSQLTVEQLPSNPLIGQAQHQKKSHQQGVYQLDSTPSLTPKMPINAPISGLEKVTLEDIPPENDDVFKETSVEVDWNEFTS